MVKDALTMPLDSSVKPHSTGPPIEIRQDVKAVAHLGDDTTVTRHLPPPKEAK